MNIERPLSVNPIKGIISDSGLYEQRAVPTVVAAGFVKFLSVEACATITAVPASVASVFRTCGQTKIFHLLIDARSSGINIFTIVLAGIEQDDAPCRC